MNRSETTKLLSDLLEKKISLNGDSRTYWAKEVTFDYSSAKPKRVDYVEFRPVNNTIGGIEHGDFYCYEVKSSVEDFHSKHGHNMLGDFNYYVMLREVYEKIRYEITWGIGVYVLEETERTNLNGEWTERKLVCIKRAKRKVRAKAASEMLLMMFRSACREIRR